MKCKKRPVHRIGEWGNGETRVVDEYRLHVLERISRIKIQHFVRGRPREVYLNRLLCSYCGKQFVLGDRVVKFRWKYYHETPCFETVYVDVPDCPGDEEELKTFFKEVE